MLRAQIINSDKSDVVSGPSREILFHFNEHPILAHNGALFHDTGNRTNIRVLVATDLSKLVVEEQYKKISKVLYFFP